MHKTVYTLMTFLFVGTIFAQGLEEFPITKQWLAKIESLAPSAPRVKGRYQKDSGIFTAYRILPLDHFRITTKC